MRWLKWLAVGLATTVIVLLVAAWLLMRASLPRLDGDLALDGLSAPVTVQRDALGVVTIDAANETDAMRALGYVHAQERFFEMDLMRRTAAGELAELFGPVALDLDKRHRVHRMRTRVVANLATIAGDKLPQLRAYTEGVNAGLAGLKTRPWPYLLLGMQPRPWQAEDSVLTGYAMYFDLQDSGNQRELALWRIARHLPAPLYALLTHDGSSWDAPLVGASHGDATLPTKEQLDLRALPAPELSQVDTAPARPDVGSNNFAVSGALTRDGRAIVADDMHLGLRAPNIWFRARLRYADASAIDGRVDVQGFTLPGLPAVIVGSNGHVAWGFTNSYVDTADWMQVRTCHGERQTSDACMPSTMHRETILVHEADSYQLQVEDTAWGPILHQEDDGSSLALRWVAQLPGALNFGITGLAEARDIDDAVQRTRQLAMPTQNLLIADSGGRIAWRLAGPLPRRMGACSAQHLVEPAAQPATGPELPTAAPCLPWSISTSDAPGVDDPDSHRLWTANARVVGGATLDRVGDAGYALGARARQARDDLYARQQFDEHDLLAIQLDDRAVFLQRWWQLLQDQAAGSGKSRWSPSLQGLAQASGHWEGRASTTSSSYRIVRAWRLAVIARIGDGLTAPARAALGESFEMPALPQLEGVAWPLLMQRPRHLLPRRFDSWDALLEDAAGEVSEQLSMIDGPLSARTWGERNTARICHPLADSIPLIGKRLLCMPADQLAGDSNMPRVAGPGFGASERMVVSPGHEADGIIHMPGGQSGHPLSPFWGAGHADWVQGTATPFLPGKSEHSMTLHP